MMIFFFRSMLGITTYRRGFTFVKVRYCNLCVTVTRCVTVNAGTLACRRSDIHGCKGALL
jgi:hypothetical protein